MSCTSSRRLGPRLSDRERDADPPEPSCAFCHIQTQLGLRSFDNSAVNAPDSLREDDVIAHHLLEASDGRALSDRQVELLARLTRGLSRTQLAQEMGVTVATVDYHAKVIRASTGHCPRELALRLLRAALLARSREVGHRGLPCARGRALPED